MIDTVGLIAALTVQHGDEFQARTITYLNRLGLSQVVEFKIAAANQGLAHRF